MNKWIFFTVCYFIQSLAVAETYLGKVGPFYEKESTSYDLVLKTCKLDSKEIYLYAEKSAKYHIPRLKLEEVSAIFDLTGDENYNVNSLGEIRNFVLQLNNPNNCLKKLTVKAIAKGINPGRPNEVYLSVWAK